MPDEVVAQRSAWDEIREPGANRRRKIARFIHVDEQRQEFHLIQPGEPYRDGDTWIFPDNYRDNAERVAVIAEYDRRWFEPDARPPSSA